MRSSAEAAEKVAAGVQQNGGKPHLVQADLSTEQGCRGLVGAVAAETDKLDVLVNNAGGLIKRQGVREYEWRLMEEIFALNTFSAMMVTTLCVPLLEKGSIGSADQRQCFTCQNRYRLIVAAEPILKIHFTRFGRVVYYFRDRFE